MVVKPYSISTRSHTGISAGGNNSPRQTGLTSILIFASAVFTMMRFSSALFSCRIAVIPGLPFSDAVILFKASLIAAKSVSRSAKLLYARSISTDRRGKSCTNKLIAVPPFNAKQDSFATYGRAAINSLTCRA